MRKPELPSLFLPFLSLSLAGLVALGPLSACSDSEGAAAPGPDAGMPPVEMPPASAAFEVRLSTDRLPVLQGGSASLEVTVTRKDGFAGAILLSASGLPEGAAAEPLTIAPTETRGSLLVNAAGPAPHSLPTAVRVRASSGDQVADRTLIVTVYGPPGSLDTSFVGGKAVIPVGASDDYAHAMVAQPDGKILVAGRSAERLGDFAVIRLERDGTLDASFGVGGKVQVDFAGGSDSAQAIALQPDGKIVVAGSVSPGAGGLDFGVMRLLADGSLDPGFGMAGKVILPFGGDGETAYAVLLQADGKLLVGGDTNVGGTASGVDFALARLLADGSLDGGFGTGGQVVTALASHGGRDSIYALALQDLGGEARILAVGGEGDFVVARYLPDGQLDPTFGDAGRAMGLHGSVIGAARAVSVTPQGQVLVAGHKGHDFALVRLTAGGQLDAGFGQGGRVVTAVSATNWDEVHGLALEADGKIVVAGWAYEQSGSSGNFALCRYSPDGQLDASFGAGGTVITPVAAGTKADQATAVLLQTDERVPTVRLLVAGYAGGSNNDFAVTRYWR